MAISIAPPSFPKLLKFHPRNPNSFPTPSIPLPTHLFFPSPTSKSFPVASRSTLSTSLKASPSPSPSASRITDFGATVDDLGAEGDEDLAASPWEGAVVYRRDASVSHVEYCTTLERLGLQKLSSEMVRTRAASMGIRLPVSRGKGPAFPDRETPVLVSLDVTRRRRRVRLDGIVRTVIALHCNRCGEPAAECVFSNFKLLLTEDPVEDPDEVNLGTIYGEDRHKGSSKTSNKEDDEDEDIDLDDQLYFPTEEREIDISKHIRDLIHIEITINAICDANCRGLCLRCGTNLNRRRCDCGEKDASKEYVGGPFKDLKEQIQEA